MPPAMVAPDTESTSSSVPVSGVSEKTSMAAARPSEIFAIAISFAAQPRAGSRCHRFEIEQRLDFDVRDRNEIGRRAQQIAGRRAECVLRKPDETRFDGLRRDGPHLGRREHSAARHVDVDVELQRDRLSGGGAFEIAVHRRDADDLAAGVAQGV